MKNSLTISLETLQQGHIQELFSVLNGVFDEYNIGYYVLGALARDIWYGTQGIDARMTRDVDLAIYVESKGHYRELMETLETDHGFTSVTGAPFRLRPPLGYTIDLIPFGIESIDEQVVSDEGGGEAIYINGLEEVYDKATVLAMDNEAGVEFTIATLPAILLLKLIAYDDRPERRTQDPGDIREIIQNYFDIEDRLIYDNHNDLFDRDLELHEYAAIVIGREIGTILSTNRLLGERVLDILDRYNPTGERLVEAMSGGEVVTVELSGKWLSYIAEGIREV